MVIDRIECFSSVDPVKWDKLVAQLSGSFFHSYDYALRSSAAPNLKPLFIKAFDKKGQCIGVTVGTIAIPRKFPFSRFCKNVVIGALPLTIEKSVDMERMIMVAIEDKLKHRGVFRIDVSSYDSPNSAVVLSSLSYKLKERFEFYVDVSYPKEDIWKKLKDERRTAVRRAVKRGVETRVENAIPALNLLYKFQDESLLRRGIKIPIQDNQAQATKSLLLDRGRAMLLVSYREGDPVNAALFGIFQGKAYYLNSGSSLTGYNCAGPVHLIWTMIEYLNSNGGKCLNLGGVAGTSEKSASEDGLYRFKKDFGATVVMQPAGTKIISILGFRLNTVLLFLKERTSKKR